MTSGLPARRLPSLPDIARRGLAALRDMRGFDAAGRALFGEVARQRRLLLPPPAQSAAAEDGVAKGLAETARRARLKRTRSYALRVSSVDCTGLAERPEGLADKAPELAELQLHLLARRAEIGHPMRAEDAFVLAMALALASRLTGKPAIYRELLVGQAAEILGEAALDIVRGGAVEPSGEAATAWAAAAIAALRGRKPPDQAALAPVEQALLGLMARSAARRGRAMRALVERHLDPVHGMVLAENGAGAEPRRYYTRPLAWLAFLRLCELSGKPLRPLRASCTVRLPPVAADAGTPDAAVARAAADYLVRLAEPPALPATWKPAGRRDGFRMALEGALDGHLAGAVAAAAGFSLRAEPLPADASAVLSVRHDVDRPLAVRDMERIVAAERALGIRSSWYFKPETYDCGLARRLMAAGCEIGYHASHAASGDLGFAQRLRAELGPPVQGCTFHGGFASTYWSGRDTLADVARLGFGYSELPSEMFAHPYRWSGAGRPLYLAPAAVTVQSYPETAEDHLAAILARRGHIVVEDHPDLFDEALAGRLAELTRAGATPRSVGEHVAVCRAVDAAIEAAVWRWDGWSALSVDLRPCAEMALHVGGLGPERVRCSAPWARIGAGRGSGAAATMELRAGWPVRLTFDLSPAQRRRLPGKPLGRGRACGGTAGAA